MVELLFLFNLCGQNGYYFKYLFLQKDHLLSDFFVWCMCLARVVTDRVTGYSRGFGFVRYDNLEGAANGIKGMDGKVLVHISFYGILIY